MHYCALWTLISNIKQKEISSYSKSHKCMLVVFCLYKIRDDLNKTLINVSLQEYKTVTLVAQELKAVLT